MPDLDRLADGLGATFARLKSNGQWSLGLNELYETGRPDSIPMGEPLKPGTPWRVVNFLGDEISYLGRASQPDLDLAFDLVWNFCNDLCAKELPISLEEKYFHVTPQVYSAGLHHAMSLVEADDGTGR
jgi:hypothetical protein